MLHGNRLEEFWTKFKTRILLAEELVLHILAEELLVHELAEELLLHELALRERCDRHTRGDEIAAFILKLPECFNDRKISVYGSFGFSIADSINAMINPLIAKKMNLVFKVIQVMGLDCARLTS